MVKANMHNHGYDSFRVDIFVGSTALHCVYKCTGGIANIAEVDI